MSSDALMDELQSFLDMGASPSPSTGILRPCPSPRASGSVPKQQEGVPSPSSAPLSSYTDVKRKLDASPGHDEIGSYNMNSPAKMPKMEAAGVKEEPGLARSGSLSNLRNLSSVGVMSGGTVKTEDDPLAPSGGPGFKSESGLDEAGERLVGGEGQQETPVEPDKQKCHATAARIRGALEASGLSGNLTSEDLQTLKRLNEIVKSTGLTQEQKSGEASQLLKNNPNVSRLLLKLRTEKNIQNQNSGMGRGTGPLGRVPQPSNPEEGEGSDATPMKEITGKPLDKVDYHPGPFAAVNKAKPPVRYLPGFLRASTVAELWKPQPGASVGWGGDTLGYGLGWAVRSKKKVAGFARW